MLTSEKRIAVAVSGASGTIYAINLLRRLKEHPDIETHAVVFDWAHEDLELELDMSYNEFVSLCDVLYSNKDLGAEIASGSFLTDGIVIAPAPMKTVAGTACGFLDNLIGHVADVALKGQRKLIVVPHETPLNTTHLENLTKLSRTGIQVIPPVLAFYNHPKTLQDIIDHNIAKLLDTPHIRSDYARRWDGDQMVTFEATDYGYSIQTRVDYAGADLFIQSTDGSHPHIGTVTTYCKENADRQVVRFPSHSGRFHKDDVLADILSEEMAKLLLQNRVITSGIHVDGISKEQIADAFGIAKELAGGIAIWLKNEESPMSHPKYQKKNIK